MKTSSRSALTWIGVLAFATSLAACGSGSGDPASGAGEDSGEWSAAGKDISWMVPSAAGGGNDIMARILAPAMSEQLDANVQVVNREGGNQVIGLTELAGAKQDGTMFGATNLPSILGRYLDPSNNATFSREDFAPIGCFASNDIVLAVPSSSEYSDLEELFDAIKAEPGTISAGTDSRGGDDHVNLATMERDLDVDLNLVHYDGGTNKTTALVAGEIDLALGGVASFVTPWKSGDVNILAVISDERTSLAPDVPTFDEAGVPGLAPMTSRFCLSVPAGSSDAIISTYEEALESAVNDPEVLEKVEAAATTPDFVGAADAVKLWEERESSLKPIIEEVLNEQ